jgi:hypothetical protein
VVVFIESPVGVINTREASPMTALDQKAMEVCQRLDGGPRWPQTQVRTRGSVQHPAGHDDDDTRRHLDMNDLTGSSALAVLAPYSAAIQRVPAVKNLDLLPDMGRMTAQWRPVERTGCSPERWPPANALQPS